MSLGLGLKQKNSDEQLIKSFGALGDPTRFNIIRILAKKHNICVSEIAQEINITTAGASQHLKILEQAGLIDRNRNGQKICYTINVDSENNRQILEMVL